MGKVGKFEESIQQLNTLPFKEDNKHIERVEHVLSSLEDQGLALIEIKPSRPSLKLKFIQIQLKNLSKAQILSLSRKTTSTSSACGPPLKIKYLP